MSTYQLFHVLLATTYITAQTCTYNNIRDSFLCDGAQVFNFYMANLIHDSLTLGQEGSETD